MPMLTQATRHKPRGRNAQHTRHQLRSREKAAWRRDERRDWL